MPALQTLKLHLLTARALRATGAGREDVLASLYAAEDAAEIQHDDLALLDARLEQAQTVLDDLRQRSQWHQSGPALLGRRGDAIDDDTLRHAWLRAAYAAEHGRASHAASSEDQPMRASAKVDRR